ncbi:helix-turn-helix domain-containing protein [Demequina capsici]|uniref:Helix-turn-helix domain-containing protein n=1 Tax=Demequina capsici TaxID=3075620 RepID=A0AA96J8T6_9MICO|nr:helix-turn-helix domain-containing protein [Demequina sp. PMTSA13]WNM26562.1 helix-turn-helix domain-containing protein [Demequina sp. PMTSA13]
MTTSRANPGPRAAAANRRALLDAGRALFDERGIDVPLVEVARRAGVGQGVLYRHFPDRLALAFAVFDENMEQLEALCAGGPLTLRRLGHEVSHRAAGVAPLLALVTQVPEDPRLMALESRMRALLTAARDHARHSDRIRSDVTIDDLLTAISMVAALTASTPPALREHRAEHAWTLLERGLESR